MNIADAISHWAARRADAIAVIEGGRSVSYQAFDLAVWRAASWLGARGVAPGDVVGVSLPSSTLHLVAVYALARLGAVQISLNPDQAYAQRQSLIRFFRVSAIVGVEGHPQDPGAPLLLADPAWLEAGRSAADRTVRAEGGAAGWRIVLSSGTTQAPKGILFSHRMELGWQSRVHSTIAEARHGRFMQIMSMSFCYGLRRCMNALGHGATVCIPGQIAAEAFIDVVRRYRITHAAATPFHLQLVGTVLPDEAPSGLAITELTVAGAIMPERLRGLIRHRLTPHLHVKYGSNEVGYLTAASPEWQLRCPETIGCAVPGVEIEIVDDEDRPLPAGEVGHLRARGAHFPAEYIGNPEASAKAFRDGFFYPGDLASRDAAGAFYFKGRADDLMNCAGIKIAPTDIETTLLQHPAVAEAAAFPLPSALHQDLPAAAVVLKQATPTEELVAFCHERLGTRAPRLICIVPSLPRNAAGKILKRELARSVAAAHLDR